MPLWLADAGTNDVVYDLGSPFFIDDNDCDEHGRPRRKSRYLDYRCLREAMVATEQAAIPAAPSARLDLSRDVLFNVRRMAAAEYQVYYLNVLAGPRRALRLSFDPGHKWIMEGWTW